MLGVGNFTSAVKTIETASNVTWNQGKIKNLVSAFFLQKSRIDELPEGGSLFAKPLSRQEFISSKF